MLCRCGRKMDADVGVVCSRCVGRLRAVVDVVCSRCGGMLGAGGCWKALKNA